MIDAIEIITARENYILARGGGAGAEHRKIFAADADKIKLGICYACGRYGMFADMISTQIADSLGHVQWPIFHKECLQNISVK